MKQTAVEFLALKYDHINWLRNDGISAGIVFEWQKHFLEQAKQMEKEQIINAHMEGHYVISHPVSPELEAEQYYNETFKQEK